MNNPYVGMHKKAFWKRSVSGRGIEDLSDLFDEIPNLSKLKIATAGSCFAQHIGRHLRLRNMGYLDYEKAPSFLTDKQADYLGYGVYSCRYGNIYTVRQLWQLFQEAFGQRQPQHAIWTKGNRYFDALRPGLQPNGFSSVDEVETLRAAHLKKVRALFEDLDVFVFTLGLTEAWVDKRDGTVFPIAPGVIAGTYEPEHFVFENFRYSEVFNDLSAFVDALCEINPKARIVFTISPVPLAATATDNHVLVATTYSKAVLRAVAGDMATDRENIWYFPSYEIITGQPTLHKYYESDLRSVSIEGVKEVMSHFFSSLPIPAKLVPTKSDEDVLPKDDTLLGYEHCEESLLDGGAK